MLVRLYTDACWEAIKRAEDTDQITIEVDLADFSDVPTSAEIHSLMAAAGMTVPPTAAASDAEGITIAEATDPMWEWFEGEDPTNWTITQAWEFDDEVGRIDSSHIEEFGLYVTNYYNVQKQGPQGLAGFFHDAYCGTHDEPKDYAESLFAELNESTDLSVWPFTCIDWEDAADELEISGDNTFLETADGQVAVFNNNV